MKNFFTTYSAYISKVLLPLGPWGVLAIAALDSAALGLPLDAVVAGYVYKKPSWFLVYPLMAAAGSVLGSFVIYLIGRKGGELLLAKRISTRRLESIRDHFEKREFFALMIPALLPPPTPFKLFVLSAGVFHMTVRDFVLAIFLGRMVRFSVLAALTRYFGPQIVQIVIRLLREHLWVSLLGLGVLVAALAWVYWLWRSPVTELAHEIEK